MPEAEIRIPSAPEERKRLHDAIQEISNSKLRIESENYYIKETVKDLCEDLEIPKAYLNKLATAYHKQNITEQVSVIEDLEALYETIFKT